MVRENYEFPYDNGNNYNVYNNKKWEIFYFLNSCCEQIIDGKKVTTLKSIGGGKFEKGEWKDFSYEIKEIFQVIEIDLERIQYLTKDGQKKVVLKINEITYND